MKKTVYLLVMLIFTGLLSACASQNIPLTDKESDAIAQYCAHLILKYDKNKVADRKLLDIDEIEDYYKELHKDDPTPSPTPTPAPTKKPAPTAKAGDKATPVPTSGESVTPVEDNREKAESLTEIFDQEKFSVEYDNSELLTNYSENEYSTFTAKDGEKIFAVKFNIKNISKSSEKFVSGKSNVGYILYTKAGDTYAPELSMLSNDIRFLSDEIGGGKTFSAVLLFIINENDKPLRLRTENGENGKVFDITF